LDTIIIERNSIPDDYLTALGRIVFAHNNVELIVIYDIHLLIRQKEYKETLCLVGGENFDILLSKLRRIFYYYVTDKTLLKEFDQIHQKINAANIDRSNYLHSYWDTDPNGQVVSSKYSKRFTNVIELPPEVSVSIGDLNSLVSRIEKAEDELQFFIAKHLDYIHAEFDKRIDQGL
jgi:hypothetical protein